MLKARGKATSKLILFLGNELNGKEVVRKENKNSARVENERCNKIRNSSLKDDWTTGFILPGDFYQNLYFSSFV